MRICASRGSLAGFPASRPRSLPGCLFHAGASGPAKLHSTLNDRDRQQIRDLIENWAVWRDAGDWDRHQAYAQTAIGYDVKRDMPGLAGPEVQELYTRGAAWLRASG